MYANHSRLEMSSQRRSGNPSRPADNYAMCHPASDGCCCLCFGPFKNAVYFANYVMMAISIGLPFFGIIGFSIVRLNVGLDNLMATDSSTIEALKELEDDAWLVYGLIGLIAAILACVPIYGARTNHAGMVGFGIVLLLATTLLQYILGGLYYIKNANEMICADGGQACRENTFRQPIGVYCISSLVVIIFLYAHVRLILEILASRGYPSQEISLEMRAAAASVTTESDDGTLEDGPKSEPKIELQA